MAEQVYGSQINDVLRMVRGMANTGDGQLTIIARALVTGCRSIGIPKDTALEVIGELFDDSADMPLVLLDATPPTKDAG